MNFLYSIAFVFCALVFTSCDPCRNLECVTSDLELSFLFLDEAGNNVAYGDSAAYDSIRFYSLNGIDTTFYSARPYLYQRNSISDTAIAVEFNQPTTSDILIDYDGQEQDTLVLDITSRKTKCCGTISDIYSFRYNNAVSYADDGFVIHEIIK